VLNDCATHNAGALIKKALASGRLPATDKDTFIRESMALALGHPATSSVVLGTASAEHLRECIQLTCELY
jgi:hypothetical protein